MIGRKVETFWGELGEVTKWEPLGYGAGACDALVQFPDGSVCWHASYSLKPTDGLGPLPSVKEAREAARVKALRSLKAIRADHVRDFDKPWPGMEFGKTIVGQAIDGAIEEIEKRSK